jgi:hypothetical protein
VKDKLLKEFNVRKKYENIPLLVPFIDKNCMYLSMKVSDDKLFRIVIDSFGQRGGQLISNYWFKYYDAYITFYVQEEEITYNINNTRRIDL